MPLYKRGNSNNYQMVFFVNGSKVRMSAKTSNKKLAQKIYAEKKLEIANGTFLKLRNSKMTFEELYQEVMENYCKVEKKSFDRDIVSGKSLRKFFKNSLIKDISKYDVSRWRKWRTNQTSKRGGKISPASVNREFAFLKKMMNLAIEWGLLTVNPTEGIRKLKGEVSRLRYLDRDEIGLLLENSADYLKPIIKTAISTCMRLSEILGLKWSDVDLENQFIRVKKTKNNHPRDIPIDDHLSEELFSMKKSREFGGFVFCKNDGSQRRSVRESFNKAVEKSGIEDFRFHDLRHTGASLLANGGCDIIDLQNIMGHRSLEMTLRYAHFMPEKHVRTRRIIGNFWSDFLDTNVTQNVTQLEVFHISGTEKR